MKIYYFDAYGRAEQLRLLLNHAGQAFEDVRFTREQWGKAKVDESEKWGYGQLPVLEKEGKFYPQSDSILRLLGREFGYYPTDAEAAYRVDTPKIEYKSDVIMTSFSWFLFKLFS